MGNAIKETRSVCEALYFCFLKAYIKWLKTYWELSVRRSRAACAEDKGLRPGVEKCYHLGEMALEGWNMTTAG